MDKTGILLWVVFALICAVVFLVSKLIKKQTEENGIETNGVISRIEDVGASDEITLHYYVRYRTEDGEDVEGVLSNPMSNLEVGQQVRIKYHPKYKANARLITK